MVAIGPIIDFGITLLNAWILAAEQQGLTREEAIAAFPGIMQAFNQASSKPVDEVKE